MQGLGSHPTPSFLTNFLGGPSFPWEVQPPNTPANFYPVLSRRDVAVLVYFLIRCRFKN